MLDVLTACAVPDCAVVLVGTASGVIGGSVVSVSAL